jgi:hypothetical protein
MIADISALRARHVDTQPWHLSSVFVAKICGNTHMHTLFKTRAHSYYRGILLISGKEHTFISIFLGVCLTKGPSSLLVNSS